MPLILRNVNKSFGEKQVLRDFSLRVDEGQRVGILGPSGGGKSTLLQLVAGLLHPDSGEVVCDFRRVGYVFQETRLMPWLTAEENVTAAAGCDRERARELLTALELDGEWGSYPDSLSGGMKQRVSIARALAFSPELLLLDEPFKGLDPALRDRVIVQVMAYHTGALLLVTHDHTECDKMGCETILEFGTNV